MCSIIYELLISTVSSYFLGDSVKQFSIIIGFYMAFMGVGSWLSRFIRKDHLEAFIYTELILGLVGAFSVPACYIYFGYADFYGYNLFMLFIVSVIGCLTGLEIPLLTKVLENKFTESEGLSNVLTLDYLGALVATLLFPFILIPFLGVYKSSLLFGMINIIIGLVNYILFVNPLEKKKSPFRALNILWIFSILVILLALIRSNSFISSWNKSLFKYPVVYEQSSSYQQITVTNNEEEFRLYLNGAIQFSSADEYRYHEALVHVPASSVSPINTALVLGGGEGLAVRELLKYSSIEKIDVVDLDPAITELASKMGLFKELNKNSLLHENVTIYNEDAFQWLMKNKKKYDIIIADLPDPTNEALSKLYSVPFYTLVQQHLEKDGIFVTQSTSPELSPKAFWSIEETIKESNFPHSLAYQVNIPSFGNWGFIIGSNNEINPVLDDSIELKFLDKKILPQLFVFPKDVLKYRNGIQANYLDKPIILEYYLEHWRKIQNESKR